MITVLIDIFRAPQWHLLLLHQLPSLPTHRRPLSPSGTVSYRIPIYGTLFRDVADAACWTGPPTPAKPCLECSQWRALVEELTERWDDSFRIYLIRPVLVRGKDNKITVYRLKPSTESSSFSHTTRESPLIGRDHFLNRDQRSIIRDQRSKTNPQRLIRRTRLARTS